MTALLSCFGYSIYDDDSAIRGCHEWHCRVVVGARTELVENESLIKIRATGDWY